jgi:hypothetical protein|tara:strand:- start:3034 stop:3414 length:381 start_codon:yes stop_codon:yes gene_type:complete
MASSSGLTRRRGGGGGAGNGEDEGSRVSSPAPKRNDDRTPETGYENSENGHKIAFDPRDMSESAERSKQPKLTLMEEIILMGLKDKQVRGARWGRILQDKLLMIEARATFHSGTTTSPTRYEAVSS